MGKVTVAATIENLNDVINARSGQLSAEQVRRVTVENALIDTGATGLLLPRRLIQELGLVQFPAQQARGIGGPVIMPVYSVARLTVQGRDCSMDVGEIDDNLPVIIGQIPLESMDWVVDLKNQKLIGNPEHGGEHILEVF
jgi:predicted aspartyl protease